MKPIRSNRFICTEISGGAFDGTQSRVLVDRKTGVNYLWTARSHAGGLTVLVDTEGKPIVTPVPADYEDED